MDTVLQNQSCVAASMVGDRTFEHLRLWRDRKSNTEEYNTIGSRQRLEEGGRRAATGSAESWVFDSRNPEMKVVRSANNPLSTIKYYYTIRSNISHRAKSSFADTEIARSALVELVELLEKTLANMSTE